MRRTKNPFYQRTSRRDWPSKRDLLVRWACVAVLPLAVAGLVALNRSAAPLDWAMSAHYTTSTYPLGLALLVLIAERIHASMAAATGARKRTLGLALAACCIAPVLQQAVAAQRILPTLRSWTAVDERVSRRLALGSATDQEILQSVHTETEPVRAGLALFRSRRLAWFAHAPEARQPFGALDLVSGRPSASRIELREGSTWVFEGWAHPPVLAPETRFDVALVVDGHTVATTRTDRPRPDLEALYGSPSFLRTGFVLVAPDGARRPPGRYTVRVVLGTPRRAYALRRVELVVTP